MKEIKVKFWCNAGETEEEVIVDIEDEKNIENEVQEAFIKWLDNNEDCGWQIL